MPLIHQQIDNGLTIGIWQLSEPSDQLLQEIKISDSEKEKLHQFRNESRKREWLAVRVLLQYFLGSGFHIKYDPSGKPYLDNSDYHIGISHTKDFAAIILHPDKPVAVDIERPSERVLKVSNRFLSEKEKLLAHEFNDIQFQTIIWCAKETMFKWWGETEVIFKEQLHINNLIELNHEQYSIQSSLTKNKKCIELPLHCWINDQFVLVYTSINN